MDSLIQANSAALSGGLATLLLYPLEKIKTKMATSSSNKTVFDIISESNIIALYNGAGTKVLQSIIGKFLYFLYYSNLKTLYVSTTGRSEISPFIDLLCGYTAEILQLPVTIPIEVISTRLQLSDTIKIKDVINNLLSQGYNSLFKGLDWSILCGLMPALQFTLYEQFKNYTLKSGNTKALTSTQAFVLGAIARAISTILVFPFIRAKVVAQSRNDKSKSVLSVIMDDFKKDGFLSFYSGLSPELMRGVLSAAIMMTLKEKTDLLNQMLFAYMFGTVVKK